MDRDACNYGAGAVVSESPPDELLGGPDRRKRKAQCAQATGNPQGAEDIFNDLFPAGGDGLDECGIPAPIASEP